jgi:flagellar basal-body rod protein FlgF
MDTLTISAAGGMQARLQSLDMLANNLANSETGGYKTDREFYNLYLSEEASGAGNQPPATLPVIERSWTDFSQGSLRATGSAWDLALSGKGFFAVDGPSGSLFTRNGSFRVSPAGSLVTSEGYPVRTVSGQALSLQPTGTLEVSPDGAVSQDGQTLGQLEVADFADTSALVKQGTGYFRSPEASRPAAGAQVVQFHVESSNVGAAESAVRLVSVMREFDMLQRAATLGAQMNTQVVEQVARVAS